MPAGGLRIKRWAAINRGVGSPHTFYDYIVAPTNYISHPEFQRSFNHEFGHTIRFPADGSETHWHWDDTRFFYGRTHGTDLFNKGFSFSEGWAHYWSYVVTGVPPATRVKTHATNTDADLDWDEHRIGVRLAAMSDALQPRSRDVGAKFVTDIQLANPQGFHTMYEFEKKYCAALPGGTNAFCGDGVPRRAHPGSCPPEYFDDGTTCRYDNIRSKPSFGRGVGSPPNDCALEKEYDWGLCYPKCSPGYAGVGPVCWESCPSGYTDDGVTCRRDAHIIGADNDACPWYDRCGLTFAGGCSVCPQGYDNDGCTCRIDVHIFGKNTHTRGAGSVPDGCEQGKQYDAGLCYSPCLAGYHGVGPVCWGTCPPGFADHPATCYRDPWIFYDDPDD